MQLRIPNLCQWCRCGNDATRRFRQRSCGMSETETCSKAVKLKNVTLWETSLEGKQAFNDALSTSRLVSRGYTIVILTRNWDCHEIRTSADVDLTRSVEHQSTCYFFWVSQNIVHFWWVKHPTRLSPLSTKTSWGETVTIAGCWWLLVPTLETPVPTLETPKLPGWVFWMICCIETFFNHTSEANTSFCGDFDSNWMLQVWKKRLVYNG